MTQFQVYIDAIKAERKYRKIFPSSKLTLVEIKRDRYEIPIINAFITLGATSGGKAVKPKDLYMQVCLNLGATYNQAIDGEAPCPYTKVIMDIRGRIRSWIEERSPCSRQHYFRGGKIANWKDGERPLYFVNEKLGIENQKFGWKPYGPDGKPNTARGDGWIYDPIKANKFKKPTMEILKTAESMYKKKGMQGSNRVKITTDTITHVFINPKKTICL